MNAAISEKRAADRREQNRIALDMADRLAALSTFLEKTCKATDPFFIHIGRELRGISDESITLCTALADIANQVVHSGGKADSTLARTASLVQGAGERLQSSRVEISAKLGKINELVDNLHRVRNVCETIDKISDRFWVVRVNLLVQCSARSIGEEVFAEVTDDIATLSATISAMAAKVYKNLQLAERDHASIQRTVSINMGQIEKMAASAKSVLNQAFMDIEGLFAEESKMVETASLRSEAVREEVSSVVVAIQFHDAMSQRIEHIIGAFADIYALLAEDRDDTAAGRLGTAWIILDMQQRQLEQLFEEIDSIRGAVAVSFKAIARDVRKLAAVLLASRFIGDTDSDTADVFQPLEKGLLQLCSLTAQAEEMLGEMRQAAGRTSSVASRLLELMEDIRTMYKETRVRAFNTTIMARHLGKRGRTIEVLAREIRELSDTASGLADDVAALQFSIGNSIEGFERRSTVGGIGPEELRKGVKETGSVYQRLAKQAAALASKSAILEQRIAHVNTSLSFLDDLKAGLNAVMEELSGMLERLAPWKNQASSDSREIARLIQRYTMEQERLIHLYSPTDDVQGDGAESEHDSVDNLEFF